MKIVINVRYGGFELSPAAYEALGIPWDGYGYEFDQPYTRRTDAKLVEVVERLGAAANGYQAELRIVEIPDDVKWYISEHDGREAIEEVHRSWS